MNRRLVALLGLTCLVSTGCFVPKDAQPTVGIGAVAATKFVHRGMIQSENGVFRPRMTVVLPTVTDGHQIGLTAQGNMDLANDNGDAWFPQGHGGRFSEVDLFADYRAQLNDTFAVTAGVFRYILPNGQEFPNDGQGGPGDERGGTTEVFVRLSANVLDATPYISWHYDFDEVHAAYYRAGITEGFEIGENWSIVLDGSIGYATSGQANWLYDLDESGLADLRGEAVVNYKYDERTVISAGVHGSAMMNSTLDQWFIDVGIPDDDPIWFSLGVNWTF